ncbi:MobC family plasmid mobilization relaxosome protein [Nocardia wallacei]|uniref:MobC family plasmid mobilization relaxosome protein n=1 Tax=Nocardia wallacei TaxID=480035 RepID=UPI002457C703|nr:MobC family plasmid mobilization relaxosome protein [Nocardia wallacei]
MVAEQGTAPRARRSQQIARDQRRRRRPNITGPKVKLEVVMSEAEYAKVAEAAEEAACTVPWYLVQSALNPPQASAKPGRKTPGPWLPWPKRLALSNTIMSAANVLSRIVLDQLSHVGANLNQLTRAANIDGVVGEELAETIEELRETVGELRAHAAEMEQLARDVTRR